MSRSESELVVVQVIVDCGQQQGFKNLTDSTEQRYRTVTFRTQLNWHRFRDSTKDRNKLNLELETLDSGMKLGKLKSLANKNKSIRDKDHE
ncbi:hypothetical protein Trydic_g7658 [Trypoxylus dichotomus]